MFLFRFLAVSLISFLLLSPLIRLSERVIEKPIVIFGIDNSESVIRSPDSVFYKVDWPQKLREVQKGLEEKAEVRVFSVGSGVREGFNADYTEKGSDLSAFFSEIKTRFTNRNVAAVIFASDGIYTQGVDPYYAARPVAWPVYTVALGDTTIRKDAIVKKVSTNRIVYRNDRFPVEVLAEFNKCGRDNIRMAVLKGDQVVESREIRVPGEQSVQRVTFWLEAGQTGIHRYRVSISPVTGEVNEENNYADFLVEVRETRQKTGIVFNAPHPDIMAIYQALSASSHFDVDLLAPAETSVKWDSYDLLILHQLPSITAVRNLEPLLSSKASLLFVLGSQTDINAFNAMKTGLTINAAKNSFYEAEPIANRNFSLFLMNREEQATLDEFPPLLSPFGTYQFTPASEILIYQEIAGVATRTPLILFTRSAERKIGIIAGENIWRWRIANFSRQANFDIFDLLMDKIAIYLSAREDRSFLRIHTQTRFSENEPVEMEAEVFNKSYERITDPDINLNIIDESGKTYPYLFSKGASYYSLNAGLYPTGAYRYNATVRVGSDTYQKSGEFYVSEIQAETVTLVANHQTLSSIALSHDGKMLYPRDADKLTGMILDRQDVSTVSNRIVQLTDMISAGWYFTLILILLAAEWVFRKREGR